MMLATFISSIVVYVFIAGEIASSCWFAHDEFILGKGEKRSHACEKGNERDKITSSGEQ